MKRFLSVITLAVALCFAAGNTQAQVAIFKPTANATMVPGSFAKVGAGGIPDNATTGTATSTVHAATINADSGKITTESLTTAAGATYTFTLTNSKIAATSKVLVSFDTASAGTPVVTDVTPGSGTCDIKITNVHASAAFNNTFKISFLTVQ